MAFWRGSGRISPMAGHPTLDNWFLPHTHSLYSLHSICETSQTSSIFFTHLKHSISNTYIIYDQVFNDLNFLGHISVSKNVEDFFYSKANCSKKSNYCFRKKLLVKEHSNYCTYGHTATLDEPYHDEFGLKIMSSSVYREVIIMVALPWGKGEREAEGWVGVEAVTCLCLQHCHLCYLPLTQQSSG